MSAKFGDLAVEMGYVTQERIELVLDMQRKGRAKLGQVLINLNLMLPQQVESVLLHQASPEGKNKKFGECAVEMGFITDKQLTEAMKFQVTSAGMLGEILVELGFLSTQQRDDVIRMQLNV
jgi:hypothetical protein